MPAAAAVSAYVESQRRFEGGLVAHALAAEMQELLHDWHTMVVQLEHQRNVGRLSLQATRFYCQPAVAAMELLAAIAARAPALRGARLYFNMLHAEAVDRAATPPRESSSCDCSKPPRRLAARRGAMGVRGPGGRSLRRVPRAGARAPAQGESGGGL